MQSIHKDSHPLFLTGATNATPATGRARRILGALFVAPVERQWGLAEREAIDVTGDGSLEGIELTLRGCFEPAFEGMVVGQQDQPGITGPVRAARVPRKRHAALMGGEIDGEVMTPVLAELLEIAAAIGRRDVRDARECHGAALEIECSKDFEGIDRASSASYTIVVETLY